LEPEQQIPEGNDSKKSKNKSKGNADSVVPTFIAKGGR